MYICLVCEFTCACLFQFPFGCSCDFYAFRHIKLETCASLELEIFVLHLPASVMLSLLLQTVLSCSFT